MVHPDPVPPGPLGPRLRPPGPCVDPAAAMRLRERLEPLPPELAAAWPSLAPVFGASPYLASLAARRPQALAAILAADPGQRLDEILAETLALHGGADEVRAPLRRLKADLHLLTALADLGGVWTLDQVTHALSRFGDAATVAALAAVAHEQRERGRLTSPADDPRGPVPGLFVLAMGKHGADELNYSSDIDLSLFWEPEALASAVAAGVEPQGFVNRLAQGLATLLSERTGDGYVFRVDLRLRPDPSSTPPVVAAPMALAYYEAVGQNWERAAFIKARPIAGDAGAAAEFLRALTPFVWRRSLDYAAVLDIQSIKRQIHTHKTGDGLQAAGADLKLGRGGIREIEFYAQTLQLILGGRDPDLRSPRTLDALAALAAAGHVEPEVQAVLSAAYVRLRGLEHRVQMLQDEQTHVLPADPKRRRAVAALAGQLGQQARSQTDQQTDWPHQQTGEKTDQLDQQTDQDPLAEFDSGVETLLREVNGRYAELFEGEEDLSSPWGSLVFTGVENDPETLATLARMGFAEPASVAETIRGWHHGRIPATRTARGRELFTRLAPRLLTAAAQTGSPDAAFSRFAAFFSGLSAGVQVQALFLNQPKLFGLIVATMAFAPRMAAMLARRPAALDSLLDARFLRDIDEDTGVVPQMLQAAEAADGLEGAMNAVRRIQREQAFRIGMQLLTGRADAFAAGRAHTTLAEAAISALARAALKEVERLGGAFPGGVAVVALGKAGSREMTAGSDLDLMTIYAADLAATSATKGWPAEVFYARFTQRLIAALSAHTAEGGLYEVDMRLRPSGSKGPVSVRLERFEGYYAWEADTWEFMALTRARVVWASDPVAGARAAAAIEAALRRPRPGIDIAGDVRRMRALMERERPPTGFWDLKLSPGGQVDAEFIAQYRQLVSAAAGGPLTVSTLEGLSSDPVLAEAWGLQHRLAQVMACAFDTPPDPAGEPELFRARLAAAAGAPDFETLRAHLKDLRRRARDAFEAVVGAVRDGD